MFSRSEKRLNHHLSTEPSPLSSLAVHQCTSMTSRSIYSDTSCPSTEQHPRMADTDDTSFIPADRRFLDALKSLQVELTTLNHQMSLAEMRVTLSHSLQLVSLTH